MANRLAYGLLSANSLLSKRRPATVLHANHSLAKIKIPARAVPRESGCPEGLYDVPPAVESPSLALRAAGAAWHVPPGGTPSRTYRGIVDPAGVAEKLPGWLELCHGPDRSGNLAGRGRRHRPGIYPTVVSDPTAR